MEYRTDVGVAQRQCPSRRPNARVNRPSTSSHVCMYACMHAQLNHHTQTRHSDHSRNPHPSSARPASSLLLLLEDLQLDLPVGRRSGSTD
jgi:hypothetical protein